MSLLVFLLFVVGALAIGFVLTCVSARVTWRDRSRPTELVTPEGAEQSVRSELLRASLRDHIAYNEMLNKHIEQCAGILDVHRRQRAQLARHKLSQAKES